PSYPAGGMAAPVRPLPGANSFAKTGARGGGGLLPDAQLFDRQSRNLRGVMNTSLRDLNDRLCDHFRQEVVAIPDAEGMQRLLVSLCDAVNLFRRQSRVL